MGSDQISLYVCSALFLIALVCVMGYFKWRELKDDANEKEFFRRLSEKRRADRDEPIGEGLWQRASVNHPPGNGLTTESHIDEIGKPISFKVGD